MTSLDAQLQPVIYHQSQQCQAITIDSPVSLGNSEGDSMVMEECESFCSSNNDEALQLSGTNFA